MDDERRMMDDDGHRAIRLAHHEHTVFRWGKDILLHQIFNMKFGRGGVGTTANSFWPDEFYSFPIQIYNYKNMWPTGGGNCDTDAIIWTILLEVY